eukprot:snap_masked-scaffold106_size358372-processed-gene-0.10 protein:Tk03533 transcript:snap_masked-scaffold106_size358372-processed-gene-0.10-mRNA-1 annotation:"dynactin subunit 4"
MTSVPCPFDEDLLGRVQYVCSCGRPQILARLYFCRHCLEPRCGYCVSHEVDSHYCPHCLENMPSAEARLKQNRCANCFDCPCCGHNLSTRATSTQVPATDDPQRWVAQKVFYLACAFCHWTSRDIGLPDQSVAAGGWPDFEHPQSARLAVVQEHYRALAQREKLEKESRRFLGRKLSYMQLSDKYGVTAAVARKRAGLPPLQSGLGALSDDPTQMVEMSPAQARRIEEVEVLPEDLYERTVDLRATTSLPQRHGLLESQPERLENLFLRHKHLMIKRSQRCRECEHNLCKPEYNPSSIKFKIQLAAFYHVPEIVLMRVDLKSLRAGATCALVFRITNPTQHPTRIDFQPLEAYAQAQAAREVREEDAGQAREKRQIGLIRHTMLIKSHRPIVTNARVDLPAGQVFLPARDDAAEFDEAGPDLKDVVDDPKVVSWRKGNQVGLHMLAHLEEDVAPGSDVRASFCLQFIYTNTISALEQKEAQKADILVPVTTIMTTYQVITETLVNVFTSSRHGPGGFDLAPVANMHGLHEGILLLVHFGFLFLHFSQLLLVVFAHFVPLQEAFIYTNTISALEQKEAQKADILVPVVINLGQTS